MSTSDRLPDHELASAYLDGDLSDLERAQVEAAPHLVHLVEAMAAVRTELAGVAPPPAGTRGPAIAHALAVFDELQASGPTSSVVAPAPVVPLAPRRRRLQPVLAAAAAVVLLGVVGVTVLQQTGSDDDDSSAPVATARDLSGGEAEVASPGAPGPTIGGIDAPANAAVQVLDEEELLELADEYVPYAGDDGGTTPDDATTATTLTSEATVVAASETTAAATADEMSRSNAFGCPLTETQVVIAEILWQDTLAVAVRDTVTGEVQAIDAQCNVLVSIAP